MPLLFFISFSPILRTASALPADRSEWFQITKVPPDRGRRLSQLMGISLHICFRSRINRSRSRPSFKKETGSTTSFYAIPVSDSCRNAPYPVLMLRQYTSISYPPFCMRKFGAFKAAPAIKLNGIIVCFSFNRQAVLRLKCCDHSTAYALPVDRLINGYIVDFPVPLFP